jgi:hypothetical protein
MKLFEILNNVTIINDAQLIERLRKFDWQYEYSDDVYKINKCKNELSLLENSIYKLWKSNPDKAISIWNKYTYTGTTELVVPSFIFRLQSQEQV